jgi:hypothetical protein
VGPNSVGPNSGGGLAGSPALAARGLRLSA